MTDRQEQLKSLVRDFLDELCAIHPEIFELGLMRTLVTQAPASVVASMFVKHLVPAAGMVEARDTAFFDPAHDVFMKISPVFKTSLMQAVWANTHSEEDREITWDWITTILRQTQVLC